MSTTIITAMQAVVSRLQGIATADGYLTDLGATVRTGWPRALIAGHDVDLPITAVHPSADGADEDQGAAIKATRTVEIEIIAAQHETGPEWLDRALHDVRRALVGLQQQIHRVITARTGTAEWSELEDTGLVRLIIPITIQYADRYGD